jgi:hypothetical protein
VPLNSLGPLVLEQDKGPVTQVPLNSLGPLVLEQDKGPVTVARTNAADLRSLTIVQSLFNDL